MFYAEDDTHELKEGVAESIPKTVSAFANTNGGEIMIGIRNNGTVIGIPESALDSAQRKLENMIKSAEPVPNHDITRVIAEGKSVIIAKIHPMGGNGYCTFKGIFYYRHGSENTRLEGAQLKDFLISKNMMYFDGLPLAGAAANDIDENKVNSFIQIRSGAPPSHTGLEETLLNLGLAAKTGHRLALNNASVLFFGKDPWRFFKQDEVRLASFSGSDPSSGIMDSKAVHAAIPENLEEAEKFIKSNTKLSYEIRELKRVEIPEYPQRAVREALVNALAHRDYFSPDSIQIKLFSNRIEFINPGIPPGGISIDQIGRVSARRNPIIYQLMRDIGYMEGLATGIPLMREEMRRAGLQQPEFSVIGGFFVLTFYNRIGRAAELGALTERQKRALDHMREHGRMTSKEYSRLCGVARPTAVSDLNKMAVQGIIKKIGVTRGVFYVLVGDRA